jgi:hypothetical protein
MAQMMPIMDLAIRYIFLGIKYTDLKCKDLLCYSVSHRISGGVDVGIVVHLSLVHADNDTQDFIYYQICSARLHQIHI